MMPITGGRARPLPCKVIARSAWNGVARACGSRNDQIVRLGMAAHHRGTSAELPLQTAQDVGRTRAVAEGARVEVVLSELALAAPASSH